MIMLFQLIGHFSSILLTFFTKLVIKLKISSNNEVMVIVSWNATFYRKVEMPLEYKLNT